MTEPYVVAFDTETRGLDWSNPDERAFLGTWADCDGAYHADLSIPGDAFEFVNALERADVLVAHNASFDVHHVREATGYDILKSNAQLQDTDLMSRIILPEGQRRGERGGHGLKHLAVTYLDPRAGEGEDAIVEAAKKIGVKLKSPGGYYDVWRAYPATMEHYARLDSRYTYDLFMNFQSRFDENTRRCYDLELAVQPLLIQLEQRGVALDPEAVDRLRRHYHTRANELRDSLLGEGFPEGALDGTGSEAALLEHLQMLGVPLWKKTQTGKISTDKYALEEFVDDFPQLRDLQEFRQANRFLSTYIGPMMGRPVVHTSFMQCEAWTGRMSSRKPNMQNIPKAAGKEVRSMFVPRPGFLLVVADYEAIEVRLLAHYLGTTGAPYRALINEGLDPHAWMASRIWGGDPLEYGKGAPKEAQRDQGKTTLFSITYGAGKPLISKRLGISKTEAGHLIGSVKDAIPGFHTLQRRLRKKVERDGFVSTLFGRKQPVAKDKAYVAMNALIQGSAADIMKAGFVKATAELEFVGGHPLLLVHDELVAEVPAPAADLGAAAVVRGMTNAYPLDPALSVTTSIVPNYSEA